MTTQQTINPFDITGKTVIITGAGCGLGASAAKGYARVGARRYGTSTPPDWKPWPRTWKTRAMTT